MRILKNLSAEKLEIKDAGAHVAIPAGEQRDLLEAGLTFEGMRASNQLVNALGDPEKCILNDGARDLSAAEAIRLVLEIHSELPRSVWNRLPVEIHKPTGRGMILCSHNFCDPCTWWQNSQKLEGVTLQAVNGSRTLYRSPRKHWIDLFHGRVTREGSFNAEYRPVVKVNGVEKKEGVDFIVDYEHGEVQFAWINPFISDCDFSPLLPAPPAMGMGPLEETDVVTATFHHAGSSVWSIKPKAGKVIRVELTEVQHTQDALVHSAVIFQPWMPNPQNPEQMIPIPDEFGGEIAVYKGATDFVNEGNRGTGTLRAFGGGSMKGITKRGIRHDVSVYPFDYLTTKDLSGNNGVELRIWCLNDVPLDGEFGSVTCYCVEEDA